MLNEVKHLREAIWLKGDGTRAGNRCAQILRLAAQNDIRPLRSFMRPLLESGEGLPANLRRVVEACDYEQRHYA